ncbi:MAG: GNAT family N-acetyltransferase, partial [Clostridia bacterium]|nr:GNAT family N-acetyltransferase [Clostridia bacterium]
MNVSKYVKEDAGVALALIEQSENLVDAPVDYFIAKSRRTQTETSDSERIGGTLARKYTVLAREGEQVIGLASMDNEGNVGLLIVGEGENTDKVASALLRALERRAEKREIPHIIVLSTSKSEDILQRRGFVAYDNSEDSNGESLMVKEIVSKDEFSLSPEKVKRLDLDSSKPVKVEGKTSALPAVLLGIACFFVILLVILSVANYQNYAAADALKKLLPFILIVGAIFIAAVVIFTLYVVRGKSLKKEILSMSVTNAMIASDIITTQSGRRKRNGRYEYAFCEVSFTYVFYDKNMKKRSDKFRYKYQNSAPYFYKGQELVVAYSEDKSYLLRKYTLATFGDSLLNTEKAISDAPLADEDIGRSELSGIKAEDYVPLEAQGKYALYPICVFLMWCVAIVATCILNYSFSKQSGKSFWDVSLPIALFAVVATVTLLGVAVFSAFPLLRAWINYKKLRQKKVRFAQGKLICQDSVYSSNNKNVFFCVY